MDLPYEIQYQYLLNLQYHDIIKYCKVNTQARKVCKDHYFWFKLANRDFNVHNDEFYDSHLNIIYGIQRYNHFKNINNKEDNLKYYIITASNFNDCGTIKYLFRNLDRLVFIKHGSIDEYDYIKLYLLALENCIGSKSYRGKKVKSNVKDSRSINNDFISSNNIPDKKNRIIYYIFNLVNNLLPLDMSRYDYDDSFIFLCKTFKILLLNDKVDIARQLINRKFTLNQINYLLSISIKCSNYDYIKYFLDIGANDYDSFFITALNEGNVNLVKYLYPMINKNVIDDVIGHSPNIEIVQFLIDSGYDYNKAFLKSFNYQNKPIYQYLYDKYKISDERVIFD